jgi:hypothetical protein
MTMEPLHMTELRKIDPAPFRARIRMLAPAQGAKPELGFVAIAAMRVDPAYQREVLKTGARNVLKIAAEFDWSKFTPVILARHGRDLYAVIDGQHRVTAAALRGITKVPAAIYKTDRAAQAAAFAAINGEVTAVSTLQLHRARLASGDKGARELAAICAQAGVKILPSAPAGGRAGRGETVAVAALERCVQRYGTDVLVMALRTIATNATSAGFLRRPVIGAMCAVLDAEPDWQSVEPLLVAMADFDFPNAWALASKQAMDERCTVESKLVDMFAEHLGRELQTREAA